MPIFILLISHTLPHTPTHARAHTSTDTVLPRTCTVANQEMYTIVLPSVLGGVLLIVGCTIWCICRRCKSCFGEYSTRRLRRKQAKHEKKQAERFHTRKEERDEKHDRIRSKYNLSKKADVTTPLVP